MSYSLIKISKTENLSKVIKDNSKLAVIKELSQIDGIVVENDHNKFSITIEDDNAKYLKSLYKDFIDGIKDLEKTSESDFILGDKPIFEKIIKIYTGTLNGLIFNDVDCIRYINDVGIATFLRTNQKGEKWYIVSIDNNYNFDF